MRRSRVDQTAQRRAAGVCCVGDLAIDPLNLDVYTTMAVAPGPSESDVLFASASAIAPGGVYFDVGPTLDTSRSR